MSRRHEIIVPDIIEDHLITPHNNMPYVKRYQKGKYLGKGGFAKCYEMTSYDTNRTYACKVVPKSSLTKASSKRKLLNEIKIHRSITHKGVVKFERFFEDKTNVYILLELCTKRTLMEMIHTRKRLTEPEVQCYMWQLMNTVRYLHKNNIIHRDLKLGNVFLDGNIDLKVGDFGLATQLVHPEERKRTLCGTPNYIAPEILENHNGHSFEVDIWSLGVIMYTLLIGRPPFETSSVRSTYKRIRANSYAFPRDVHISSNAKRLISTILNSTPELRPSCDDILNHAFFSQSSFPKHLPLTSLRSTPRDLQSLPQVRVPESECTDHRGCLVLVF
jgi:polo-like kinase 1